MPIRIPDEFIASEAEVAQQAIEEEFNDPAVIPEVDSATSLHDVEEVVWSVNRAKAAASKHPQMEPLDLLKILKVSVEELLSAEAQEADVITLKMIQERKEIQKLDANVARTSYQRTDTITLCKDTT